MKMTKIIALVLVLVMSLSLVACTGSNNPTTTGSKPAGDTPNPLAGTYDITMWVSETAGVAAKFQEQIDAFEAANPGIVINAQVEGVSEANAASQVLNDVASAPDIFCFAQDQLARLVQAQALAAPLGDVAALLESANDTGSVNAAKVAGKMYAYPMTADNGYFMYYNKSIINEEDAGSMEKLIAACEANNLKFRYALENGWYTASFFFATGCHSTWSMNEKGEFIGIDDDFNSEKGMIAMKGMQKLAQSSCYDSNADIFTDAGVVISGTWLAEKAIEHFGENMGVAKLPSFTVDGETYQLGSFSGYKMMGVKPQQDAKKGAVLALLAQFLTNAENQLARFQAFGWGPSNKEAQANEAVKSNPALIALAAQNQFAIPQGQIEGMWWDTVKVLGASAKNATSDSEMQTALDNYDKAIEDFLKLPPETRRAWTVIGNVGGSNWDTDFTMTEGPENTWTSVAIEMKAGQMFKVRQGLSWTNNYGAEGKFNSSDNILVEADGTYQVVFVWDGDTNHDATITLVPVEE